MDAILQFSNSGTPMVDYLIAHEYSMEFTEQELRSFREREKRLQTDDPKNRLRRLRISMANKRRSPWNSGKTHSQDTKTKISRAVREAMMRDEGIIVKLREARARQGKMSDEARERMKEAMRRRRGPCLHRRFFPRPRKSQRGAAALTSLHVVFNTEGVGCVPQLCSSQVALGVDRTWFAVSRPVRREREAAATALKAMHGTKRRPLTAEEEFLRRKRLSDTMKAKWQDPEYVEKTRRGQEAYIQKMEQAGGVSRGSRAGTPRASSKATKKRKPRQQRKKPARGNKSEPKLTKEKLLAVAWRDMKERKVLRERVIKLIESRGLVQELREMEGLLVQQIERLRHLPQKQARLQDERMRLQREIQERSDSLARLESEIRSLAPEADLLDPDSDYYKGIDDMTEADSTQHPGADQQPTPWNSAAPANGSSMNGAARESPERNEGPAWSNVPPPFPGDPPAGAPTHHRDVGSFPGDDFAASSGGASLNGFSSHLNDDVVMSSEEMDMLLSPHTAESMKHKPYGFENDGNPPFDSNGAGSGVGGSGLDDLGRDTRAAGDELGGGSGAGRTSPGAARIDSNRASPVADGSARDNTGTGTGDSSDDAGANSLPEPIGVRDGSHATQAHKPGAGDSEADDERLTDSEDDDSQWWKRRKHRLPWQ